MHLKYRELGKMLNLLEFSSKNREAIRSTKIS